MSALIDAIASPLKAAGESLGKLVEVRDTVKFGEEVAKVYSQLMAANQGVLAAQDAKTELLGEISALKARISELETWEAEKQRYALQQLPPGVFVYALRQEAAASEPSHNICQTCYQRGKKSILTLARAAMVFIS